MDTTEIAGLESELVDFLAEFDDCFGRSEPREHLRTYVSGQLSGLERKSVEPIALAAEVPPRTLQRFLESIEWDEERLRDKLQHIVAREHPAPEAIGIIDETGHPKKGKHTAGVKRQWCGNTGKVDNCVVSVHTGYVAGDFQCLLDNDVYLSKRVRSILYQQASDRIKYHQWRNHLARQSHRKRTLATLTARGIKIEELPSCRRDRP